MKKYIYNDGYEHLSDNLTAKEIKSDEQEHGLLKGVFVFGKGYIEVYYGRD